MKWLCFPVQNLRKREHIDMILAIKTFDRTFPPHSRGYSGNAQLLWPVIKWDFSDVFYRLNYYLSLDQ